ncbi:MAG: hypothetical protein H6Q21_2532, partial [Bacteroidetes bacterium]|nr:hypothetical protein [Bacteroidota bacterium]
MNKKSFAFLFLAGMLLFGCTPKKGDKTAVTSGDGLDRSVL